MKKILWVLKWLFIFIVVVLVLTSIYEQYARYSSKKNFIDNGTYVKVDGHKMHYVQKGVGTPTVIFESGLDFAGHMSWYKVQNEISKLTTTISYDRAGILRSEKSHKARTCENMADEVHILLEKTEAKKPYIFVAHSIGGLIARCYAKKYADSLGGIVFVDATHPKQMERASEVMKAKMKAATNSSNWMGAFLFNSGIARIGLNDLLPRFVNDDQNIEAIKSEINAYLIKSNEGVLEEGRMLEQMLQASKDVSFGDIPFINLSANGKPSNEDERVFFEMFRKLQEESLTSSTNSKLIAVDSGHYIQIEKPEVVIEAIKEMVENI